MFRDLIKWVVPGLVTVCCGTTLCLAVTSAQMSENLADRAASALSQGGYRWAEFRSAGRDIVLAGTATASASLDDAVTRLSATSGVRNVATGATLAPLASPYVLTASINAGKTQLAGSVPDLEIRQDLAERAGLDTAPLQLRSGMPEHAPWIAGAQFAVDTLRYFDQGEVVLSDTMLKVTGRARSERAYRDVLIVLRAGPPRGLTLSEASIMPPLVDPYRWNASFDGKRIEVTGFVPEDAAAERIRTADVSGVPITTTLALGSGESAAVAALSVRLLEHLAKLEYGAVSITGSQSTLAGAPPSAEVAQAIIDDLRTAGSIITLEPPPVDRYWTSAVLDTTGSLRFDGYVPDDATRKAFAARDSADVAALQLGRGASEHFEAATSLALTALSQMSEGRFTLRDTVLSLSGTARSDSDYRSLEALFAEGVPQGVVLAKAEVALPEGSALAPSPVAVVEPAVADPDPVPVQQEPAPELSKPPSEILPLPAPSQTPGRPIELSPVPALEQEQTLLEAPADPQQVQLEPEPAPAAEPHPDVELAPEPQPAREAELTQVPELQPALTPEAEPEPEPEPEPAPAAPASIPACAAPVAQFSARNAIFFRSGASSLAAESGAALDELAIDLAACPEATVHIEGHTDSDGDEAANLALSVARAEAVVRALVERGVAADRLYAIGYGQSAPIADNSTAQGKRMNRRIVVTVQGGDQR